MYLIPRILERPKLVLLQTVKTQIKCHMQYLIRVSLFAKTDRFLVKVIVFFKKVYTMDHPGLPLCISQIQIQIYYFTQGI